jgi:hypothetical protein
MSEINLKILEPELSGFLQDHCKFDLDLRLTTLEVMDDIEQQAVKYMENYRAGTPLFWRLPSYLSKSGDDHMFYPARTVACMTIWGVAEYDSCADEWSEQFYPTETEALLMAEEASEIEGVGNIELCEYWYRNHDEIQSYAFNQGVVYANVAQWKKEVEKSEQ